MTPRLRTFSEMKDSGIEWLGEIPAHWTVLQLGQLGRLFKGGGGTKDDETETGIPCIRYGDLYTQHEFHITKSWSCVSPETAASRYTPIRYGDVLFAGSGETIEEIGKSAVNLINGPACCGGDLIVFRPSARMDARFLGYASDCPSAAHQKATLGRGITVMHIYGGELKYLHLALPPLSEQAKIARFLDHADRRIRRAIRAKEKLIALLEEQKQALIHDAVTGRTDVRTGQPYPAYKDSGVEWLDEVPAHWDIAALRFRYTQCLGKMLDAKTITGEHLVPYIRNIDVQWDRINVQELPRMDIRPTEYERYTVREGDLLVCEGGEVGRCALWSGGLAICGFQKAIHRLRPRDAGRDLPRFMYYCLKAAVNRRAFSDGHESTISHLTGEKLRANRFPFPTRPEQDHLVSFLDSQLRSMDRGVAGAQNQIDLLNEYRARLIANVVTGKLDVREAAASLPDEDAPTAGEEGHAGR